MSGSHPRTTNNKARFGAFTGVFTPNVLTILGLVLFLRLGWVIGSVGLWGALAIILLANVISFLSGLSLSALTSSLNVKEGGYYFIISRSLGLEIGAAIGLPLFVSQAVSVAFYVLGFTESLHALTYFSQFDPRWIATIVALVFCLIAYVGADFALRIQYFILAILVAALGSFFLGGWESVALPQAEFPALDAQFWLVFAVFFPAVTGIEVGASLSGDLKDPARAIPLGTLSSILATLVVYVAAAIWLALHFDAPYLRNNLNAMATLARWPWLILAGVWASTLSSALGAVLAAPRTLQALGSDQITPRWTTAQLGSPTEPRAAVLISGVLIILTVWTGELNLVAAMVTMFFLNTYGMVNLAAAIEQLVNNPSYRPSFRFTWPWALLGALGCYGAMLLIHWQATLVAIVVTYGLFLKLHRDHIQHTWGDLRSGIWFSLARHALLRLAKEGFHEINWRPNIMVFTGQAFNRPQLLETALWLSQGQGILSFFQLIKGTPGQPATIEAQQASKRQIAGLLEERGVEGMAEALVIRDFYQDVLSIVQTYGIAALEFNTILLGRAKQRQAALKQLELARHLLALRKSLLILDHKPERDFGKFRRIDLWWRGGSSNAGLMLLLAHMIHQHPQWRGAELRLLRMIESPQGLEQTQAYLKQMLARVRVRAEPQVLVVEQEEDRPATIIEQSASADLVLLGLHLGTEEDLGACYESLNPLVENLGSTLLVRNARYQEDILQTG